MNTIIQVPWRRLRARDLNPALVVAIKKELQLRRLDCPVVVHTHAGFGPILVGEPAQKKTTRVRLYKMVVYTSSTRQINVGDKWLLRAIAEVDGAEAVVANGGRKVKNTQNIAKNVPLTLQEVMIVAYWRQQEGQCPTSP